MKDKIILTICTVIFFIGAGLSLRYSQNAMFFGFASGLCSTAFGGLVALVRGDKPDAKFPDSPKSTAPDAG